MAKEKEEPLATWVEEAAPTAPGKVKRKYRYIGQPYNTGVYLPDLTTKIKPRESTDQQIEAYIQRFPQLLGRLWEEVK